MSYPTQTDPPINPEEDILIACPQCGEEFAIQVPTTEGNLDLIEDCAVCCRPMTVSIRCRAGEIESVSIEAA